MSTDDRLERILTEVLDAGSPSRPPDRLYPETLRALRRVRRWPRWLALIKEPPMRTSSGLAVGSPTARVAAIMLATLLLALTLAGAGIAGSRLLAADGAIVVAQDGTGHFTTITEAVAAAVDGDTILVRPGTYDESIVLGKDVTIRGDGDRDEVVVELSVEIPDGDPYGWNPEMPTAFLIEASDAVLENLTLRGEASRIVIHGGAPELRNLVFDGVGRVYRVDPIELSGLHIYGGSEAMIANNVLTDTDVIIQDSSPTLFRNAFSVGALLIHVGEEEPRLAAEPVIRENTIDGSVKWGIAIWGGARPEVVDNTIVGAETGIIVEDPGSAPMLRGNTISGSRSQGIRVVKGAEPIIEGNVLTDNNIGISSAASDAVLVGNTVSGGGVGILITGGSPTLEANGIDGAERGLVIGFGTMPTLEGNTVCGNETDLVVPEGLEMPDPSANEICEDTPAE